MARHLRLDESDRDCETPGTVMTSQLAALPAAFAMRALEPPKWADYITDALSYHGMRWQHGGKLEKLSCRQAGLVLYALHFGPGVPHGH